ncbi:MAG TPA: DUF1614 domain-containing protein [Nitrososphaerales archaeon]|nr:DUF1614 domain-containing protein [Nitrososphaerales archaeon]
MSQRVVVHRYHHSVLHTALALLAGAIIVILLLSLGDIAFERLGFNSVEYLLILWGTLLGSMINVPVGEVKSSEPLVAVQEVRVFGLYYRVPSVVYKQSITVIAVNVGGAVIPILVSAYVLLSHTNLILAAIIGTIVVAVMVHLMARKVKGVGIVTPAILPPVIAAVVSYLLVPGSPAVVAYVSGTLGALIGADLTNLRGIGKLGAPMASIGGAGTFDGVFLTGIVAVLLVPLL